MQLIENIKDYFGLRKLQKKLSKSNTRKKIFCNLNDAKNVGLIYEVKNEADYKKLLAFVKHLKGEYGVRNISSIAFYNEQEEPFFLQSKLSFDFFMPVDLSWRREPLKDACKVFAAQEFDLLIDLTDEFSIPLRTLLISSKAKFKVGKYSEENEPYYDFMIAAAQNNFHQFTQEAIRYLTMINAK